MKSNYLNCRKYQTTSSFGFHIIEVEPYSDKRPKWSLRFMGSPVWHVGFKSKFDAMIFASHSLGYSMKKCNWSPL